MIANIRNFLLDASAIVPLLGLHSAEKQIELENLVRGEETNLYTSELCKFEVGNALLKYDNAHSQLGLKAFETFSFEFLTLNDIEPTLEIAKKFKLTFYDASYITLLDMLDENSILITYDNDFKKVSDPRIMILR